MTAHWRRIGCLAAALVLAACATLTPPAERVHTGRFSLVTANGERKDNTSGRFVLAVHRTALTLDLGTPIGTTLARIEIDDQGARLTATSQDGPQELRGPDAETLTQQFFGWALPVSGLGDWILGRPAPGRPANIRREYDQIVAFEQDGWSFEILDRFANDAPRRLVATRAARADAPAITLRLVLEQ
jgi:outer membrane lipoprotein LolB